MFPDMARDANINRPLSAEVLRRHLEDSVSMVLSIRRSVGETARDLSRQDRPSQERFLWAVDHISQETAELAFNFCMFGLQGLQLLTRDQDWQAWVRHILDTYDQGGVLASIVAMQKVEDYARSHQQIHQGIVWFDDIEQILQRFITGLSGRICRLEKHETAYTDSETIYLPESLLAFPDRDRNYSVYKAMVTHQWAQNWYGTWRISVQELIGKFPQASLALDIFHFLETIRLNACLQRDLPGLFREIRHLHEMESREPGLDSFERVWLELQSPSATVHDTARLVALLYEKLQKPPVYCYQGILQPELTEAVITARKTGDFEKMQQELSVLYASLQADAEQPVEWDHAPFRLVPEKSDSMPDGMRFVLHFQGQAVPVHEEVQKTLDSIVADFGFVPPEYLQAAGKGPYAATVSRPASEEDETTGPGNPVYREWDYLRQRYRKDWCVLHQRDVHPQADNFVADTIVKYRGLLKHLHRTFEALRGEDRRLRKEGFGDDLDLDTIVSDYADQMAGQEGSDRIFIRRKRVDRNVAVIFLVDMSGSTKGRINQVIRESLVLLCESLQVLGDRYAVYGFSGFTHKRCELLRIKTMEEEYDATVKSRISGIRPQDYTRMGVFIRHAVSLFQEVEARTKLLITLSDGRPDDQDGYRGVYGIEDTRQALLEARFEGIHPYCITIDDEAMDYLPHMYGHVSFTVVSDVYKLPFKVSDIYRRITMS